jgi:hypothetical protein
MSRTGARGFVDLVLAMFIAPTGFQIDHHPELHGDPERQAMGDDRTAGMPAAFTAGFGSAVPSAFRRTAG